MGIDRAAFVDVRCIHHLTDDFTEPDLSAFFVTEDEEVRKEELLCLGNMTQYAVYWTESSDRGVVNYNLSRFTGLRRPIKIMIFRRRVKNMRFTSLSRMQLHLCRLIIKR